MRRVVDAIWHGRSAGAVIARTVLAPAERIFGMAVARRNARFDATNGDAAHGGSASRSTGTVPALSVGNLTVGGTGKTPVSAWCTRRLRALGARPAIVLRGYGDDEPRVHALLNPDVPVVVSPDRAAGLVVARTRGADCAVLDDAFQHRQAHRTADLVLLSADQWDGRVRLLPAGPYREPLASLRRADVVIVTVKAADARRVGEVEAAARRAAPDVPCAVVQLVPGELRLAAMLPAGYGTAMSGPCGASRDSAARLLMHPARWLAGRHVVTVSAIGDPAAFEAQLRALGAEIVRSMRYADHHRFGEADTLRIVRAAESASSDPAFVGVVCTLKDAVKLRGGWPRQAPPLWYVSQSVVVERGAEALERVFARVLGARAITTPTAG